MRFSLIAGICITCVVVGASTDGLEGKRFQLKDSVGTKHPISILKSPNTNVNFKVKKVVPSNNTINIEDILKKNLTCIQHLGKGCLDLETRSNPLNATVLKGKPIDFPVNTTKPEKESEDEEDLLSEIKDLPKFVILSIKCVGAIERGDRALAVHLFNSVEEAFKPFMLTEIVKKVYKSRNSFRRTIDFLHDVILSSSRYFGLETAISILRDSSPTESSEVFAMGYLAKIDYDGADSYWQGKMIDILFELPSPVPVFVLDNYIFVELENCGTRLDSDDMGFTYTHPANEGDYQQWVVLPVHEVQNAGEYFMLQNRKTSRVLSEAGRQIMTVPLDVEEYSSHWKLTVLQSNDKNVVTIQNRYSSRYMQVAKDNCGQSAIYTGDRHEKMVSNWEIY